MVCGACRTSFRNLGGDGCRRCAEWLGPGLRPPTCRACEGRSWHLDAAHSAVSYEGAARAAILRLKDSAAAPGARELASWMLPLTHTEGLASVDVLVDVPSPLLRRLRRGHNQSRLLAQELSTLSGIPYRAALARPWWVKKQSQKTREERLKSAGGFRCVRSVEGLHVALVDDVMTTGATLNACAQVLRNAGATRVIAFTVARTLAPNATLQMRAQQAAPLP